MESFSRLSPLSLLGRKQRSDSNDYDSWFGGTNYGLVRPAQRPVTSSSLTILRAGMKFKNFEHVLDTFHKETVIIYFEASKCGPCRLMKKELESVKKQVGNDIKIFSLDTEKFPNLGSRYNIHRLPCLVVVRDGEIRLRMEGVTKAEVVVEHVQALR
jgi:thiol-disulfide isomerase/thioredoxin